MLIIVDKSLYKKENLMERLGGSVVGGANYSSGHDLVVCEFEPHVGLCPERSAQSLEPASHSVSPSLSAASLLALLFIIFEGETESLCLCLSLKNNK